MASTVVITLLIILPLYKTHIIFAAAAVPAASVAAFG